MSLPPVIVRDPGVERTDPSERVIYNAYIESLDRPSRTSPERAILRAAGRCGVSRRRVLDVIRRANPEVYPL
jgi:hypothetical protein